MFSELRRKQVTLDLRMVSSTRPLALHKLAAADSYPSRVRGFFHTLFDPRNLRRQT